jgi:hypothetical protein
MARVAAMRPRSLWCAIAVLGLISGCGEDASGRAEGSGGAGIPGVRGPVSSKMPKPKAAGKAAGKVAPAAPEKPAADG